MRLTSPTGRVPSRSVVWLCLLFLLLVWAFNFIAGKIALRSFDAPTLATFRVFLAGVCVLLLYPLFRRVPAFAEDIRAHARPHSWRDLWTFAYLGFFGVVVNQVGFTIGLRYTSVGHSAIIVGLGPIYALVLAVLFRLEALTFRKVLGMSIALAGIILMATGTGLGHRSPTLLGDLITFAGSIGFALYAVLGKRVAARYDALTMSTWNFVAGALIVSPFALQHALSLGPLHNWLAISWQSWAAMLYMALFSSALAYLFYFWLLRYLEVTQLAAYNYLLPVTATLLGILFLGERASRAEFLGSALALAGVYYLESARPRPTPSPAPAD